MPFAVRKPPLPMISIAILLLSTISHALPYSTQITQSIPKTHKTTLLHRRDDTAFLGEDWEIAQMQNNIAYTPHHLAAHDLTDFYTSLLTLAQFPSTPPNHWLIHRIGRVMITFQCHSIFIPWSLIQRFAERMLVFTERGYTSSYLMVFRHLQYGHTITVTLAILDQDPGPVPEAECVAEEHGQVNQSGISQHRVCVRRERFGDGGQGGSGGVS
ncbi:MAG: hypothetical protein Q9169_007687 [Polycauliona sp. 2 TL-2023]